MPCTKVLLNPIDGAGYAFPFLILPTQGSLISNLAGRLGKLVPRKAHCRFSIHFASLPCGLSRSICVIDFSPPIYCQSLKY
jgi:hypothetical protein